MRENLWKIRLDKRPALSVLQTILILLGGLSSFFLGSLLLPRLAGVLSQPISIIDSKMFWYISRGSGIIAFLLLWLSMLLGLFMTTRIIPRGSSYQATNELHKFVSWLGLAFILLHAIILLGDEYIQIAAWQLFIPFTIFSYHPLSVGGGQIVFYIWLVLLFSFSFKKKIGQRTWRIIHYLGFAAFWIVLAHGILSGTDSATLGMQLVYWTSAASVLLLTIYRIIRSVFSLS